MPLDDLALLRQMLIHVEMAMDDVLGVDLDLFQQERQFHFTVLHELQIVGEAARDISRDFREDHPEIPWADWVAFRNRIVHEYFGIDYERVWEIATTELETLSKQLRGLLSQSNN